MDGRDGRDGGKTGMEGKRESWGKGLGQKVIEGGGVGQRKREEKERWKAACWSPHREFNQSSYNAGV